MANERKQKQKRDIRFFHDLKVREKPEEIQKVLRFDYPVYKFPVVVTERCYEDYELLDLYLEKMLAAGGRQSVEKVSANLGLQNFLPVIRNTARHLTSIGHLNEQQKELTLTPLGVESLRQERKIYEAESKRILYFDAIGLTPFPGELYTSGVMKELRLGDSGILASSDTVDIFADYTGTTLQQLIAWDGKQRIAHNLPQEMTAIALDPEYEQQSAAQHLLFYPLYIVISGTEQNIIQRRYEALQLTAYCALSGKISTFFTERIAANPRLRQRIIHDTCQAKEGTKEEHASAQSYAKIPLDAILDVDRLKVDKVNNFHYRIMAGDMERWKGEEFGPLRTCLAKYPFINLHNNEKFVKVDGTIMKFYVVKATYPLLRNMLLDNFKVMLAEKDYSRQYIEQAAEQFGVKLDTIWQPMLLKVGDPRRSDL